MAKALHPTQVIIRPLITEKAARLAEENKYAFQVHPEADKTQIRQAVEKVFGVKVVKVNVINLRRKARRTRGGYILHGQRWKKAIVTLAEGHKIELFEGV
ncbi:MAG TPA: 50S ribosomal protein L23 [Dehalococcoidia bacterium]|nr:50S ribosomal protein L23 [Dehalococcoidia bacterium]